MWGSRSQAIAVLCCVLLAPEIADAQRPRESAEDLKDVLSPFLGPNWNLSVSFGTNNHGRFILQRAAVPGGGTAERVLRAQNGYAVGFGAGVDILLRAGVRLGYTYGTSDFVFRTDAGDGSEILDVDELSELTSHTLSIELLRYMLPSTATITPYASAGFVANWYSVEEGSVLIANGDNSQFRTGALAGLGLKVEFNDHFDLRIEGLSASVRNPFTGRDSYHIPTGATVDEPTRVTKTTFRAAAVYNFGKPEIGSSKARRARRR
jgi:opacity protein-like surface antigen